MEHVQPVSKAGGAKCLPQPSVETGGGCLTIEGAVAAPVRHCHGVGENGLDYHRKRIDSCQPLQSLCWVGN